MILKQYYLGCLSHASYLVADEESKLAAVIDPQRDIDEYLTDTRRQGLTIRCVLLTHFHADFVSGHLELREKTGATIGLGASAAADYPFQALRDGDVIDLGRVRIRVLETPGHTPESVSYLVYDLSKDEAKPQAVLTGDTLFIGDVGRPDLLASSGVTAEQLGAMLYASIRKKLMELPDETLVYPAHGAGSMCGKNLSNETVSTIGKQKAQNYALAPMTEDEFVRLVAQEQPECPGYFAYDATMNRRERPTLEKNLEAVLKPLTLREAHERMERGAILLDVRDPAEFVAGHLAGSVNVTLKGKYATWVGSVIRPDEEIVIAAEPGKEREAAMRLGRIGFDRVAGFLDVGPKRALSSRPDLLRTSERVSAADLRKQLASTEPPVVIDVRAAGERADGRMKESVHIPLHRLRERLREVPRDRPVVLHCAGGVRSVIAMSLLERDGAKNVRDLIGGYGAWQQSALSPMR